MPWSLETEKALLSCMLQYPARLLPSAIQRLPREAFYHAAHEQIYARLLAMYEAQMPIDLVSVTNALRDAGELDKIGGAAELSELWIYVPVASHWDYYIQIALNKWHLRRLIALSQDNIDEAHRFGRDEGDDLAQFVGRCEQRLFELCQDLHEKSSRRGMVHVSVILPEVVDQIEKAMDSKGHVTRGIATGLTSLDRITMGIETGMFVIAARPSRGKTALVMQMALNIGLGEGDYAEFRQDPMPVGVFSLETNDANLVRRGLLNLAALNMRRLQDGFMTNYEKDALKEAHRKLISSMIYVEAAFGLTIQELRVKARNAVRKHGLRMIIIDYLQLLQTTGAVRKAGNRQAELAEISIAIKSLSHELDLPIVVLAQLNRDGDTARPKMSQIRDCGQIEQDADYCGLLCDPPAYASQNDPEDCPFEYLGLDIAKQKDGATTLGGEPLALRFHKEFFRISSKETKLFSNDPEQRQPRPEQPKFDANRPKQGRGRPRKDGSPTGGARQSGPSANEMFPD
jgi:replicative DNA helicase